MKISKNKAVYSSKSLYTALFQERSSVLAAECASALLTSSSAHS